MSKGEVFAPIAQKYDRINTVLSLGRDRLWRQRVVDRLPEGRLLDLGAGTGAAATALGERQVVALDPSLEMLALNGASQRVGAIGEALPFMEATFDAVLSAYVFRNLDSVEATLTEIARVLRPGGKAGIVGLGRPRHVLSRAAHRFGTALVLPAVGLVARAPRAYSYLHRSLDKLPPPEELFLTSALTVEDVWRMGAMGFVYGAILVKP